VRVLILSVALSLLALLLGIVVEENLSQKAAETGAFMMKRLKQIEDNHSLIGEIRD